MLQDKKNIYLLGIGGIGMSALARYFKANGFNVAGYDRVCSQLTKQLEQEGMDIHYSPLNPPQGDLKPANTLVIYTPAIPEEFEELAYFRNNGFQLLKRSQALGEITKTQRAICVAGTHGKTTTSTMIAHLLHQSHVDCSAFLGGISNNFNSNLHLCEKNDLVVIEADEYDRSFLTLSPSIAVITSADADHLDIYKTEQEYYAGFEAFTSLIKPGGTLLIKKGVPITPKVQKDVTVYTYSMEEEADFYAENISVQDGKILFDWKMPHGAIREIQLGSPVLINVENGIAAMTAAMLSGAKLSEIRNGMATYKGVKRRFDFQIKNESVTFVDDYAHHPEELKACIRSMRLLYPDKRISGIFQPHLYTRTRDFADDFAESLSLLDELLLMDIYPAREEPIKGIDSKMIWDKVTIKDKKLVTLEELKRYLNENDFEVLLTMGAGDIELLVPKIKEMLLSKIEKRDMSKFGIQ